MSVFDPVSGMKVHNLVSYSRTKKTGLLASGPKSAFLFVPAERLDTDRDLTSWQDQMHSECTDTLAQVHPALKSGLEKQYAIQRDLFASKDQAQAE